MIVEYREEDLELYKSLNNKERRKEKEKVRTFNNYCKANNYKCKELKLFQCWFCGDFHCKDEECFSKLFNNQSISTLVKYFNFDTSKLISKSAFQEIGRIKEELIDLYYGQELSIELIAKKYNVPISRTVYNVFKHLNIPRRNFSDAVHLGYKYGRGEFMKNFKYQFHTEYHKSWDNKTFLLRSSNESRFANFLDSLEVEYEYENLRIEYFDTLKNKFRIAIPDFYVKNSNSIFEIKSSLTLDVLNMIDKFDSYKLCGYTPHLILNDIEVDLYTLNKDDYQLYKIFGK